MKIDENGSFLGTDSSAFAWVRGKNGVNLFRVERF